MSIAKVLPMGATRARFSKLLVRAPDGLHHGDATSFRKPINLSKAPLGFGLEGGKDS
jgi:hypothetical protein